MKRLKRLLSVLLACCLLAGLVPATALAADTVAFGTCGDDLTWVLDSDGTLTISGTGDMANYSAAQSQYSTGTAPWHDYDTGRTFIKTVKIGSNVTGIGDYAFCGCEGLTSVTIPDGVTSIGQHAFSSCTSLAGIDLPSGITNIGDRAFAYCYSLNKIDIPGSVASVGQAIFNYCENITTVSIGYGVPTISDYMFDNCKNLTEITIPSSVTSIGDFAFRRCAMTNIDIPDSVTNIGDWTFAYCPNLTDITIPSRVAYVGDYAFYMCGSLTSVTIQEGPTSIGYYAFYKCPNLKSITIPKSIAHVYGIAFEGCNNLVDVYYGGSSIDWANMIEYGYIMGRNDPLLDATIHYNSTGPEDDTKPDTPENPKPDDDTKPDIPEDSNSDNDITSYTLAFHTSLEGRNTDAYIDTEWGWDLFLDSETYPSTRYESRLAVAGLALSAASEYSQNRVEEMLEELGFESDLILSQNYNADWHDLSSPGVTFAHKSVKHNGEDMHVIVAVLRGTTTISDMVTDFASLVDGFQVSESSVYQMLERYIDACSRNRGEVTTDNVKFFVTGHSLGGAVANLLAGRLTKRYGESNVFAYTFAAPRLCGLQIYKPTMSLTW